MVPTGVIEVVRGPNGDVAGIARVVRLFRSLREPNRLIPFDPTLAIASGRYRHRRVGPHRRARWR
jgi:hypothetical protein